MESHPAIEPLVDGGFVASMQLVFFVSVLLLCYLLRILHNLAKKHYQLQLISIVIFNPWHKPSRSGFPFKDYPLFHDLHRVMWGININRRLVWLKALENENLCKNSKALNIGKASRKKLKEKIKILLFEFEF